MIFKYKIFQREVILIRRNELRKKKIRYDVVLDSSNLLIVFRTK